MSSKQKNQNADILGLLERTAIARAACEVMLHIMETRDTKWIVVLGRFAFSISTWPYAPKVEVASRKDEIKKGVIAIIPNVHCKKFNPYCPCSIFYNLFLCRDNNFFGLEYGDMVMTDSLDSEVFGPAWDYKYVGEYDPKRSTYSEGEVFPLVETWNEDRRRSGVLALLLRARYKHEESPFHKDNMPLDMFKIVVALAGLMPWRGRVPPKLAALWEAK